MKQLSCEMCGSKDLLKQDGVFVCQSCGTKYTVEEVNKIMVDVSGSTVKVDTSAELANLYQLARRAKDNNDSENAQKYYEKIIKYELKVYGSYSWEAAFYSQYFGVLNNDFLYRYRRLPNLEDVIPKTQYNVLEKRYSLDAEVRKAIEEVTTKLFFLSSTLLNNLKNNYESIDAQTNPNAAQRSFSLYQQECSGFAYDFYHAGDYIFEQLKDCCIDYAVECWKMGVQLNSTSLSHPRFSLEHNIDGRISIAKQINHYKEKIKKYDSSYNVPLTPVPTKPQQGGGCYVATAVYGSYDCPQVWTLRRYRDYTLAETWYGRAFIRTYYAISPTLVKWFGHTDWFKNMWKGTLDRMVADLNASGVEDSPYEDKVW